VATTAQKRARALQRGKRWVAKSGAREKWGEGSESYPVFVDMRTSRIAGFGEEEDMEQVRHEAAFNTGQGKLPPFHEPSLLEAFSLNEKGNNNVGDSSVEREVRLNRIMRAFVQRDPCFGHVQGLREVGLVLALFLDEEASFWLMATMMEVNPPPLPPPPPPPPPSPPHLTAYTTWTRLYIYI